VSIAKSYLYINTNHKGVQIKLCSLFIASSAARKSSPRIYCKVYLKYFLYRLTCVLPIILDSPNNQTSNGPTHPEVLGGMVIRVIASLVLIAVITSRVFKWTITKGKCYLQLKYHLLYMYKRGVYFCYYCRFQSILTSSVRNISLTDVKTLSSHCVYIYIRVPVLIFQL